MLMWSALWCYESKLASFVLKPVLKLWFKTCQFTAQEVIIDQAKSDLVMSSVWCKSLCFWGFCIKQVLKQNWQALTHNIIKQITSKAVHTNSCRNIRGYQRNPHKKPLLLQLTRQYKMLCFKKRLVLLTRVTSKQRSITFSVCFPRKIFCGMIFGMQNVERLSPWIFVSHVRNAAPKFLGPNKGCKATAIPRTQVICKQGRIQSVRLGGQFQYYLLVKSH